MDKTESREYRVEGMTCSHCAASVVEEVTEAEGVDQAEVVLGSRLLKVRGNGFTDEVIVAAVESAGYRVGVSS